MQLKSLHCCGLKELAGISSFADPEALMIELVRPEVPDKPVPGQIPPEPKTLYMDLSSHGSGYEKPQVVRCAFIAFTEARAAGYGKKLRDYIIKHKLGTVTETENKMNTNSGNNIRVYMWGVDFAALEQFRLNHPHKKKKKESAPSITI